MIYSQYCRSLLSTPALTARRYAAGHQAGADVCVVDLEDSIPATGKSEARRLVAAFFSAPTSSATRCGVRINSVTEADGLRDILAILEYPARPRIVVIPKVESPRDIEITANVLGADYGDLDIYAVVETPRGIENISSIVNASPMPKVLIFGSADYTLKTGAKLSWDCLTYARARLVNSARAAEIEALDAPSFDLSDADMLRCEAGLARDLGFSGKVAIHPRQVPVINEVFTPDAATINAAQRVIAASEASNRNIAVSNGMMLGTPFFRAAQQLLDQFNSGALRQSSQPGQGESHG
jgi:citrate lyase subunit beta/citryl-CoA lyase/(S)-citramalyl-CoA lyase